MVVQDAGWKLQARSVIVLVPVVIVTASTAGTMLMMGMIMVVVIMLVLVCMIVAVGMPVVMAVRMRVAVALAVAVAVRVVMMMMPMIVIAHMGAALRLERALHRSHGATLAARQFRQGRVVLDVESIIRGLDEAMVAAEMPGETHEAQGVLCPDLQQRLRRRLHLHKLSIPKPQGIAVVDGCLHVEIEMDVDPALAFQSPMATVSRRVVEGDGVDDAVGLHGGLADDGGDAGHGFVSVCDC
jgi:hypothetical protein